MLSKEMTMAQKVTARKASSRKDQVAPFGPSKKRRGEERRSGEDAQRRRTSPARRTDVGAKPDGAELLRSSQELPPAHLGNQSETQSPPSEPNWLGIHPTRSQLAEKLKGQFLECYLEYYRTSSPTPSTTKNLPRSVQWAMEAPARAWNIREDSMSNKMTMEDIVASSIAYMARALNYQQKALVMARDKEEEVDSLAEKLARSDANLRAEVSRRQRTETVLKRLMAKSLKMEKLAMAEKSAREGLEKCHAVELEKKVEEVRRATKASAVEEYKASDDYNTDLNLTYVVVYDENIGSLASHKPGDPVEFLRKELES